MDGGEDVNNGNFDKAFLGEFCFWGMELWVTDFLI